MVKYRNARHLGDGRIDCEIEHPVYGWIPFTCDPKDTGTFFDTAELHAKMTTDPATAAYVPPTDAEIEAMVAAQVRSQRDMLLLTEVDPVVCNPLRWGDLTDAQRMAWAEYRRALLDISGQAGFPHNVIWPEVPK